jgi:mediator of replication checkpoint protein 1
MRQQWLAEEAEESDEDQMAGFGFIKKKDGEGDEEGEGVNGEDLDAPLAELVDDQKMDEEVEAADRVMEKHQ